MSKRGCCVILHSLLDKTSEEYAILLCRRSSEESVGAGTWCFPGGTVNDGEMIRHAANRELYEETGFIECTIHQIAEYDYKGWQDTVFVAYADYELSLPKVGISSEVDGYMFASIEAIEMLISKNQLFDYSVKSFIEYKKFKGITGE